MEYKDIFPIIIGEENFNIPTKILDEWKQFIDLEPTQNPSPSDFITKNQNLLDSSIFITLKNVILDNVIKYAKKISLNVEGLQICNSWAYITTKGNIEGSWHSHSNSLITGTFYLTEGAPLYIQNPYMKMNFLHQTENSSNSSNYTSFNPSPGKLLLFPSFLDHMVGPNTNTFNRYCIAFNIIPKGKYGDDTNLIYFK